LIGDWRCKSTFAKVFFANPYKAAFSPNFFTAKVFYHTVVPLVESGRSFTSKDAAGSDVILHQTIRASLVNQTLFPRRALSLAV